MFTRNKDALGCVNYLSDLVTGGNTMYINFRGVWGAEGKGAGQGMGSCLWADSRLCCLAALAAVRGQGPLADV
jgi:hypothetical protein